MSRARRPTVSILSAVDLKVSWPIWVQWPMFANSVSYLKIRQYPLLVLLNISDVLQTITGNVQTYEWGPGHQQFATGHQDDALRCLLYLLTPTVWFILMNQLIIWRNKLCVPHVRLWRGTKEWWFEVAIFAITEEHCCGINSWQNSRRISSFLCISSLTGYIKMRVWVHIVRQRATSVFWSRLEHALKRGLQVNINAQPVWSDDAICYALLQS